jgi:hypothetical protein
MHTAFQLTMISRTDARRGWHLTLALLSLIVAAFSRDAVAMDWTPLPTKADFTYLSESAIRIGDHIYLAEQDPVYRIEHGSTVLDDKMRATSLVEFDCAAERERILLLDSYRGDSFLRIFEDASRSYKQAVFKSYNESSPALIQLRAICALPLHRERLVNIGKGDGDTLLQIDTRSVRDTGLVKTVWTRIDYPMTTLHPPYGAPYDSIRELISLDCTAREAQVLIRYYFSPAGGITDATKLLDQPAPASSFQSDPRIEQVAHTVCGETIDPEHFSGQMGGSVMRTKPETPEAPPIDVGPISDDIRAAAGAFSRALPGVARFSKATVVEMSTNSSSQFPQTKIVIELRPQPDGTTLERETYGTFYLDRASVGGLAQLASRMVNNTPEVGGSATEQLSATIPTFTDGAAFTYRTVARSLRSNKLVEDNRTCRVGKAIDAAALNANLAGAAWPINCMGDGNSVRSGYYVEALRFFFVTESDSSSFGKWLTHIDAVSIEQ